MKLQVPTLSALLLAALCAAVPAQTLEVFESIDTGTKTTSFKFNAVGPASGTCYVFASTGLTSGLPLPFGTFYLDPAVLLTVAVIPLNSKGVGSTTISIPSLTIQTLRADVQAVFLGGAGLSLSNYSMLGHYASTTLSEDMAGRYDARTDHLRVAGKGRPGDLIEVFRIRPGIERIRLGSLVVPPAPTLFAFGRSVVEFKPGDQIEVVANGLFKLMLLQ